MYEQIDFYRPKQKYIGESIQSISELKADGKNIIISGFPYDEGTKINGGRVGGAIGCSIFRKTLLESNWYVHNNSICIYDSCDICADMILQDAHVRLYQKHKRMLIQYQSSVLFSIGGSNDQSYPNAKALMEAYPNDAIGVINLDSHFDVRPLKEGRAHSGSPFRQMLLDQNFHKNKSIFIQFACKGATCSNQHYKFLKEHGVEIYWLQKDIRLFEMEKDDICLTQAGQLFKKILKQLATKVAHVFISFDTDSINSKYMPGVSAPSVVGGLSSGEAMQIMRVTGSQPKVRLVDFSEFNPAVESWLSSHLLVQMFYNLVIGLGKR